jgi:hypothetical protein
MPFGGHAHLIAIAHAVRYFSEAIRSLQPTEQFLALAHLRQIGPAPQVKAPRERQKP